MDVPALILIGPGEKKNGKGYDLQASLTSYIKELNEIYVEVQKATGDKELKPNKYASMTLDPKEDPQYQINGRLDDHVKGKDWVQANFDHSPMVAVLAALTDIQSKVVVYEGEVLSKLSTVVGASDFKFDKLDVMANADASTVAAGTKYKARIFLTAFSDKMAPEMTAMGRKLKVNGGIGTLEFQAKLPKSKPNKDGLYPSSYNAVIEVPDPLDPSTMQVFKKKVEYFVSKPVIQVQSDAVSALYKDCGNPLNIQVPALGTLYSPSFKVTGAIKKTGKGGKGSIVVVPNQPKVSIAVSSGGNYIGTEKFKVRLVPKPELIAKLNSKKGKPVDQKRGMKAPGPRKIYMDAVPDNGFAKALPKDARFRTVKWTATLVRGKRPVGAPKTFTKPDGNLTAFAQKAKPGDRIMIEVKKVIRMNYLGKKLDVNIGTPIINIPLTD
jgi:gliding motility-associated protein GldM